MGCKISRYLLLDTSIQSYSNTSTRLDELKIQSNYPRHGFLQDLRTCHSNTAIKPCVSSTLCASKVSQDEPADRTPPPPRDALLTTILYVLFPHIRNAAPPHPTKLPGGPQPTVVPGCPPPTIPEQWDIGLPETCYKPNGSKKPCFTWTTTAPASTSDSSPFLPKFPVSRKLLATQKKV